MAEETSTREHTHTTIDGVDALVNLDSEELFLDLPIQTPRYIRVREGERLQQGDVRTQPRQMGSQTLSKWRIDSITTDTVTGVDVDSGETKEWDREWVVQRLGTGGFSAELNDFDRVSVTETSQLGISHERGDDREEEVSPHVIVTAYGNTGQKFTQSYSATESGDWESLRLVKQDRHVEQFDEELREKFDAAVERALEMEREFH